VRYRKVHAAVIAQADVSAVSPTASRRGAAMPQTLVRRSERLQPTRPRRLATCDTEDWAAGATGRPIPRLLGTAAFLAGRRTWDTRDEFCASVCFMSAGVLLRRPAHTKTSCVGFRETQGQRVQIPFGLPFFARAKKV